MRMRASSLFARSCLEQATVTEAEYRSTAVEDRNKALNMMLIPHERLPKNAEVQNTDPLPRAVANPLSEKLQVWCEYNSWHICSTCQRLQPRELTVEGLEGVLSPWCPKSKCVFCRNMRSVPSFDVEVEVLQHLPAVVLQALSPVEANYGPHQVSKDRFGRGNGYRVHAAMVTFSWHAQTVAERVQALQAPVHKASAERALAWLLQNSGDGPDQTAYGAFCQEQETFVNKYPQAEARQRKRWLRFIESEGLECALWPHIFTQRKQCLTWARQQSSSRQARGAHRTTLWERAFPEPLVNVEEEAPPDVAGTKRSYMALLFSPVLDVSLSYEILHFTYDLNLWTDLGSKTCTLGSRYA